MTELDRRTAVAGNEDGSTGKNPRPEELLVRSYFPFRPVEVTVQTRKLAATRAVPEIALADGLSETFAWFELNVGFDDTPTAQERVWLRSLGWSLLRA